MSELRQALEQAMSGSDDADDNESVDTSVIDPPDEGAHAEMDDSESVGEPTPDDATDGDDFADAENAEKDGEPSDQQQAGTSSKTEKPPVGWTPETREHWAKLPDSVRKQVSKREAEVNKLLQDTSDARKLHQEFGKTVEPYRSLMASQGVQDPLQAVNGLLETAAALSMGNTQQKAQRLAGLIKHYGIDIEALDSILAGEEPQADSNGQMPSQFEEMLNQRLAPFEQERQRSRQEQDYQVKQRAASSVNAVAQKEFFNDVRVDMADIVELATKRGQTITLEQAYEKAVMLNPEIQKVIRGRGTAKEMGQRQLAASGIRGNRGGVPSDNGNLDLRSQLEANWNASSTGRT